MGKKSSAFLLLGIVLAACAIRLCAALRCNAVPDFSDMALYNAAALQHGFPMSLPPGYPLFLRAIYGIFGAENYKAVFVVQGLVSAATVLLMYRVAGRLGGRTAGLLAAGVAAVYPNFIAYNLTTLTDTIGVLFVVLLPAVCVEAMSERKKSILAALVLFLGFAFRPVMILFAPGVFLGLKKRWTFALAAAALLAPLVAFEMIAGESFQRSAVAVYETYHPSLDGSQFIDPDSMELGSDTLASTVYLKTALTNVSRDKWKAVDHIYNKATFLFSRGWDTFVLRPVVGEGTFRHYAMSYAYIPVLAFGFIGMVRLYGRRNRILALPALAYLALVIIFFLFKFRYRLLVEPILIIFAAMFIARGRAPAEATGEGAPSRSDGAPGRFRGVLAAILFLALALRIHFAFACPEPSSTSAMVEYNRLACEGGLGSSSAPLYPLFLRAIYSLFGAGNYTVLFLVQGILGALVVVLMYTTFARMCGRTAGLVAAAFSALYPRFIVYGLTVQAEWMSILVVVALMAAATARLNARRAAALSAVLVALGILVEPLLVCLAPGALLAARRKKLFMLVLLLALAPFVAINAAREQKVEPVYTVPTFGLGIETYAHARGWDHAIDNVYRNVSAALTRERVEDSVIGNDAGHNGARTALYSYVVVMFFGFVGLARRYRREQAGVVLPVLVYIGILVLFSRFEVRYRVPLEPVLIGYAAALFGGCGWAGVRGEEV
jgi:4-amino-4-deoxy-L-arabinose transferase-like glycosyltransferase